MASLHVNQVSAAKRAQKLVVLVFLTLVGTLVWASIATLEEAVVGIGTVVPAQAVQRVESLDGGILKQVLVQEGQRVKPGEKLILLEEIRFSAAMGESAQEQLSLMARIIRLTGEINTVKISDGSVVLSELDFLEHKISTNIRQQIIYSYQSRLSQLKSALVQNQQQQEQEQQAINEQQAHLNSLSKRLNLLTKEVNLTAAVVAEGAVAEMELLQLQRQQVKLEGEEAQAKTQILILSSSKRQIVEERKAIGYEFLARAQSELDEVNNNQAKLTQSAKALADRLHKTKVTSPVAGTVKNIITRSVGEVIEPGQTMMEIVPLDDQLLIETQIASKDIGFLHVGMAAMVKFTAYDFVIYGGLKGEVIYVGADAQQLEDGTTYYEAHIKTIDNTLANHAIIPGMQASVDVITGRKTVLNYWLKPLLRAKANAMKER